MDPLKLADDLMAESIWWRDQPWGDSGLRERAAKVVQLFDDAEAQLRYLAFDRLLAAQEAWARELHKQVDPETFDEAFCRAGKCPQCQILIAALATVPR